MSDARSTRPYHLESSPFDVAAWPGGPVPRSYASSFPFVADDGDPRICDTCTFRPWRR